MAHDRKIAVVGLGYVGLPVATAFGRQGTVVAFDIDRQRVDELKSGLDRTHEISPEEIRASNLHLTADVADLKQADFFIVCVPTPIDAARRPDLTLLLAASHTVGQVLKPGDIVVYESTVYPGTTEEECIPVLESESGLECGVDFSVGYSPERVNPGDKEHRFETIRKVVSGLDERTTEIVADVYGSVVTAGIYRAPSIKVAETAKVIENAQRDLNVAFMNELSSICHKLGIDTGDVLEAARTKWNFLPFTPGLVGGHCIGVDPYYLTYRAEKAGHHPQVILAGRRINDEVGERIARECVRLLMGTGTLARRVTILGLAFKENVNDIRNSKIIDIVRELKVHGVEVQIHDPMVMNDEAEREYAVALTPEEALAPADAVIFAVAHQHYLKSGWPLITRLLKDGRGIVLDVKHALDRATMPTGVTLWRL
jgi:UDP-N-acetyl-D-galactosamine dehydrogenase